MLLFIKCSTWPYRRLKTIYRLKHTKMTATNDDRIIPRFPRYIYNNLTTLLQMHTRTYQIAIEACRSCHQKEKSDLLIRQFIKRINKKQGHRLPRKDQQTCPATVRLTWPMQVRDEESEVINNLTKGVGASQPSNQRSTWNELLSIHLCSRYVISMHSISVINC